MQREDVACEIAKRARKRLALERVEPQPISNKLLVPLLEKGSCENIDNEQMIERWANLLASASMQLPVQPRFISILGALAGPQAICLDCIAFNGSAGRAYAYRDLADSYLIFAGPYFTDSLQKFVRDQIKKTDCTEKTLDALVSTQPGVLLTCIVITDRKGAWLDYDRVAETGTRDEDNLSILVSLGLVREMAEMIVVKRGPRRTDIRVILHAHSLTELGVNFVEVCARPRVVELESADQISASKGIKQLAAFE